MRTLGSSGCHCALWEWRVGEKTFQVFIRMIDASLTQKFPLLKELGAEKKLRPQQGLILGTEAELLPLLVKILFGHLNDIEA